MSPEAYARLDALYEEQERLTPPMVVSAAEPESSPLHSYFTWDDSVAGYRYRLEEARTLIRSYKVQLVETPGAPKVQKYISIEVDRNVHEYQPTTRVMVQDDWRQSFLAELHRELRSLREKAEKYQMVGEFRDYLRAEASK